MSGVLRTVGKVAGIVATVAAFIPGGQPIAAAAAAVALVANVGAQLTAAKPPHFGSVADIQIGAEQPRPYMMGDTYNGGALVHQIGFGASINKVPNPYLAMAIVYSAGGPIAGIDTRYADFQPLTFKAGAQGEASGYFSEILFHKAQLGQTPEPAALSGPWAGIPNWSSTAKLSGLAAELWSLKWDSKNNKYAAGAPQVGIRGRGVLTWDPRKDSTWPGGSGAHRWLDPRVDPAGFAGAKATWTYSARPGLHALRYVLGTWERAAGATTAPWLLTFGVGMPVTSVVVEDFIELENVCEANGWEISGVIFEPGDKWANFKRILAAGGAEPCFKGGRLGLKISAPRVSLDTITLSDLADGESTAAGAQPRRDRINTAIPKYRSPDHKWELQQSAQIVITNYLDQDGEEKRREVVLELVKDVDQAAQLATYELFNSREQGPIELACGPRMRRYAGGDKLTLSEALRQDLGLQQAEVVVVSRVLDPATMNVTLTLVTEYAAKHSAALQVTGVIPAAITLPTTEQLDDGADYTIDFGHVVGDTRPEDGATVGAPIGTDVGGVEAGALVGQVSAAAALAAAQKLRVDTLTDVTIPAINTAVGTAQTQVDQAHADINAEKNRALGAEGVLDQRITSVAASSGYDDTALRALVSTADSARVSGDVALGQRLDTVQASIGPSLSALATQITTAYVAADKVIADRTTAVEATIRADTSLLNSNGTYSDWTDGQLLPARWGGGAGTSVGNTFRVQGRVSRYAVRQVYDAANGSPALFLAATGSTGFEGVLDPGLVVGPGWFVLVADVELESGTLAGSGMYVDAYSAGSVGLNNGICDFGREPDSSDTVVGAGVVGRRYQFTKLVQLAAADVAFLRFHPMTSWDGFGFPANAYKTLVWHRAGIRRATAVEIAAGKAAAERPSVLARISVVETAIADGRFATALRATTIEASLNDARGRLLTVETATTDGRFAAASRVSDLEATSGNLTSRVSVSEGAIAGLGVRQAAYFQVLAVAGNNRAQLTISADANSGAGVDIVGDVGISGNLLVSGTIVTDKLVVNSVNAFYTALGGSGNVPATAFTTIATVTANISSASSQVRLIVSGGAGLPGLPTLNFMELKVLGGSSVFLGPYRITNATGTSQSFCSLVLLTGLVGTQTFIVQAKAASPRANADYDNPSISVNVIVEETKR